MPERRVVIIGYPGVQSLDAGGPFEVFAGATRASRALGGTGGYRVSLASSQGLSLQAESGVGLCADPLPPVGTRIDTLVLPGGGRAQGGRSDPALMAWIRAVAPRCRRVATVCTGAFL